MTLLQIKDPTLDERAERLVALANSEHLGVDELVDVEAVARWWDRLTGERLEAAGAAVGAVAMLHALRVAVHGLTRHNNPAIDESEVPVRQHVLRVDLTVDARGRLTVSPVDDTDVVSRVTANLAECLLICGATRDWRRVRACAAPDCGWVFIDRSKNASRRWCDMGTCGTRAKVRSHRSRRAALPGADDQRAHPLPDHSS